MAAADAPLRGRAVVRCCHARTIPSRGGYGPVVGVGVVGGTVTWEAVVGGVGARRSDGHETK